MSRGDAEHGRRPLRGTIALLLVLVLAAGAALAYRGGLLDDWLDDDRAGPADPAQVEPPDGVEVPDVAAPAAVAKADDGSRGTRLDPAKVRQALAPYLSDRKLGRHVRAVVAPLDGGPPTVDVGSGDAIPASTTKIVTSTAALLALGPSHTFTTQVQRAGRNRIVLVGGGDPFLAAAPDRSGDPHNHPAVADVVTLARATAKALRADGVRSVSLGYDGSLFAGPAVSPQWEDDYVPGVVSPVESLWVDQGRESLGVDPAVDAAQVFAKALGRNGVAVRGTPAAATAPQGAAALARVQSAPLDEIVAKILEVSDNEGAEVLLRHVGLAQEGVGSFDAGRRGVIAVLKSAGIRLGASVLHDGSGLSRQDRLDPKILVDVLRLAASSSHPELRSVITGLPVSGFVGSLADRMDGGDPSGLGRVRAKTGTLSRVRSLAGIATDLDGTTFAFVLMIDRFKEKDTLDASETLDNAAAALGACRCSR